MKLGLLVLADIPAICSGLVAVLQAYGSYDPAENKILSESGKLRITVSGERPDTECEDDKREDEDDQIPLRVITENELGRPASCALIREWFGGRVIKVFETPEERIYAVKFSIETLAKARLKPDSGGFQYIPVTRLTEAVWPISPEMISAINKADEIFGKILTPAQTSAT